VRRWGKAALITTFSGNVRYPGLRQHYDQELARRGWQFTGVEPIRDWWRDLGGESAHYRKGPYRASLLYAGESAKYAWDYSLDMSWQSSYEPSD